MNQNDELTHYSVVGMKWGVRRGTHNLKNATSKEKADKAIKSLDKNRAKASAKLSKLQNKEPKLQKEATKASKLTIQSSKAKAAIAKNKRMQDMFKKGIDSIDKAKVEYGKAYIRNIKNNK